MAHDLIISVCSMALNAFLLPTVFAPAHRLPPLWTSWPYAAIFAGITATFAAAGWPFAMLSSALAFCMWLAIAARKTCEGGLGGIWGESGW